MNKIKMAATILIAVGLFLLAGCGKTASSSDSGGGSGSDPNTMDVNIVFEDSSVTTMDLKYTASDVSGNRAERDLSNYPLSGEGVCNIGGGIIPVGFGNYYYAVKQSAASGMVTVNIYRGGSLATSNTGAANDWVKAEINI